MDRSHLLPDDPVPIKSKYIYLCPRMKKTILILALLVSSLAGSAQQKGRFAYDAAFDTYFDNREFAASGDAIAKSMTIFGARLTPEVGFTAVTSGRKEGLPYPSDMESYVRR
mgnify:CR=1 FL=1